MGDAVEQAQDAKAMLRGSLKEKAAAAKKTAIRAGANAAALATFGNKELSPIFQKALETVTSKKFLERAAIVIASLIILAFTWFDASSFDVPQDQTPGTVQVTKTGPAQVSNGQPINYSFTVSYSGNADDITITDPLPAGTTYVSSNPVGQYDKASNTVTWHTGATSGSINLQISLTVKPTKPDFYAINQATAVVSGGTTTAQGSGGSNLPPNSDTCSGVYSHYMSITPGHQNYGDPSCELVKKDPNGTAIINKDLILKQLQSIKPSEAMGWFICVVPNESAYNANAYLRASTSGNGAYGLVQMNPTGKGNGPLDDGEVNWQNQLSNGINYNDTKIGHTFAYWPTSYDSCLRSYGVTVN